MKHVDLCSGIGGFALGFQWAGLSNPILFCDIEPWSRQVLKKHWPNVPIAEDVRELANDPNGNVPDCDIITAGYPCQPFSLAGKRRGAEDHRHIWPYIFSIIQTKRPSWCVFENVHGHVSMGLDEVLSDLEGESYTARPFIIPACAADAPHRRNRVWIIGRNVADTRHARVHQSGQYADASQESEQPRGVQWDGISRRQQTQILANASRLHSDGNEEHSQQSKRQESQLGDSRGSDDVAYTASKRQQGSQLHGRPKDQDGQADRVDNSSQGNAQFWLPEPPVGRVANGIPRRVDRLRGLGNAIVPQIAMKIGQSIKYAESLDQ